MDQRHLDPRQIVICQPSDLLTNNFSSNWRNFLHHDLGPVLKSIFGACVDRGTKKRRFQQMCRQGAAQNSRIDAEKLIGLKHDSWPWFAEFSWKDRNHDVAPAEIHGLSQSFGPTASIHPEMPSTSSDAAIRRISRSICLRKISLVMSGTQISTGRKPWRISSARSSAEISLGRPMVRFPHLPTAFDPTPQSPPFPRPHGTARRRRRQPIPSIFPLPRCG